MKTYLGCGLERKGKTDDGTSPIEKVKDLTEVFFGEGVECIGVHAHSLLVYISFWASSDDCGWLIGLLVNIF